MEETACSAANEMRDAPHFRRKCARNRDFFLKSLDFFRKPCYNKQRWFSHGFLPYSNPKIERCEPPINSMNREVNEVAEY